MPELPEVEVVKRSLKKRIKNLTFRKISIFTEKLRYPIDKKALKKIRHEKIIKIYRRSKYLIFNFKNSFSLLVHLGMTGKFIFQNKLKAKYRTSFYYKVSNFSDKHNHIKFEINKNLSLIYNDVRKFGFIKLLKTSDIKNSKHLKSLGPEPLSNKFNVNFFLKNILQRKINIKNILMDQKFVSGLGNIYVNEALFLSKINPNRSVKKISVKEIKLLIKMIKTVLKRSISFGGSSIKDFKDSTGKSGNFQQKFYVYDRDGLQCLRRNCTSTIKRRKLSNRSSFYCKICQK